MQAILQSMHQESSHVRTFRFTPGLDFKPGQFVMLTTFIDGEEVKRAYSLANTPCADYFELTIELVPEGKMSTYMFQQAAIGNTFSISAPKGRFYFDSTLHKDIVMLAAGSGIVPMRSIMQTIIKNKLDTRAICLHSCKSQEEIIYKHESFAPIHVLHTLTQEHWSGLTGRINAQKIMTYVKPHEKRYYFLCGSAQFCKSMRHLLIELGVQKDHMLMDVWG